MELSNEFVEDLFLKQIRELTIRTNKQTNASELPASLRAGSQTGRSELAHNWLKSFDAQFSGIKVR